MFEGLVAELSEARKDLRALVDLARDLLRELVVIRKEMAAQSAELAAIRRRVAQSEYVSARERDSGRRVEANL